MRRDESLAAAAPISQIVHGEIACSVSLNISPTVHPASSPTAS
jgi:hypothetical protein